MLNKTLRGYYKRMLYQNRGPVARGLDFLALTAGLLSILLDSLWPKPT